MRAKVYIHVCYCPKEIHQHHLHSKTRQKILRAGLSPPSKGELIGNVAITSFKVLGTITLNVPDAFEKHFFHSWSELKTHFIMTNGYEHYQRITQLQREHPLDKKADQAPKDIDNPKLF